jgi:hypothetical protein
MTASPVSGMSEGGQLALWGMRHLMLALLQCRPLPLSVLRAFDVVGGARSSRALAALLLLIARDADRPLQIHPPCCRELSADEESIAAVLTAVTGGGLGLGPCWRALLDGQPSAALRRHARSIGEAFRAAGLRIELFAEAPSLSASAG